MIEVLRLSHRIARDKRITTHLALTSRTLSTTKFFYSGDKDKSLEESINKVTKRFGGPFTINHTKEPLKLVKQKKKQNYIIVHLTAYGTPFDKISLKNKKILIIVGGEKVEPEYYKISDFNLAVGNQPHSELGAIAIFLYKHSKIKQDFKDAQVKILPLKRGKLLKDLSNK